jgi:hypothetical protein
VPSFPLIAKEVYRRDHSERMDENRTYDCAYANRQRKKNRELMMLRHLFHHHILAHNGFTMRATGTNNVRTAVIWAAVRTVQTVADYTTTESCRRCL